MVTVIHRDKHCEIIVCNYYNVAYAISQSRVGLKNRIREDKSTVTLVTSTKVVLALRLLDNPPKYKVVTYMKAA